MASIPFTSTAPRAARRRQPLTGARLIIVAVSIGFAIFIAWAMLAQVDEVSAGQGKVIPSSKVQLIQAAEPTTISELLVRSGQRVRRGQLLARLDNTQSTSATSCTPARSQYSGTPLESTCLLIGGRLKSNSMASWIGGGVARLSMEECENVRMWEM